ncbi:WD domain, G-beta repeat [Nesidiocoris tenuis]|uniref:WD domain, G-beta repeat n=1 Tax=Nesidiocoris tenuis TaxID=355587 RepID=A0ABN7ABS0_9HEMI|nr:WD domain, G-beta repeat [Nesidiocoris tenuis]
MRAVSFVTRNEIAGGNLKGQISVWDVRQDVFTPTISFPYNSDQSIGVTQLVQFPTQRHILVGAGADGSLSTWDLRKTDASQTIYAAHRNHITDLRFHNVRPGNGFSCSFDGDVWHWNNFAELLGASVSMTSKQLSGKMPNVLCLLPRKKFPVNSIDVIGDSLVAAYDNDLLVYINNLQLK